MFRDPILEYKGCWNIFVEQELVIPLLTCIRYITCSVLLMLQVLYQFSSHTSYEHKYVMKPQSLTLEGFKTRWMMLQQCYFL